MTIDARGFVADRGDAGARLDRVVCRHLAAARVSRARVQCWIAAGLVAVDGRPWQRASARVPAGARVDLSAVPLAERRRPEAEPLALDVLYEDDDLLIVNKPPGQVVHPSYKHAGGTTLNALLWRAGVATRGGDRPSLVNRLDKGTSGLVVVARRPAVHAALQRALAATNARKDYLAVVYGVVRPARGALTASLARDPHDRRRVVAATGGRPAETRYEAIALVPAPCVGLSVLRCQLLTGRLHQIRVHLAHAGWPIVGDGQYADPRWRDIADPVLAGACAAMPRQALHASRLRVTHPVSGLVLEAEAPLPPDLQELTALLLARADRRAP
jgi:23S rRNA pseudouridine1911/1915/1917 synthase